MNKNLIVIRLHKEGLGNQLFIYAYARFLAHKFDKKILICYPKGEMDHGTDYEHGLKNYPLQIQGIISEEEYKKIMLIRIVINECFYRIIKKINKTHIPEKIVEKKFGRILNLIGIKYNQDSVHWERYFDEIHTKKVLIKGYYQVPYYAEDIRDILLKEFRPITADRIDEKEICEKIRNEQSVCIHVRKGDYLNSTKLYNCNKEYYRVAVEKIAQKVENVKFYVFSDDIEYVKKEMKFCEKYSIRYVTGSDDVKGITDFEEMYLMSCCKHFIIANSSFSWWSQFLSENKDKIVIAPKRWYKEGMEDGLLFQKNFVYVD